MTAENPLKAELYRAFLKTTLVTGQNLKRLSWFGRNHKRRADKGSKKAA